MVFIDVETTLKLENSEQTTTIAQGQKIVALHLRY
jgi:hypothetical protein